MDPNNIIECGGFYFIHNFDSGNLGHVERVPTELIGSTINPKTNAVETPDYEFNMWTRPDCAGTEFENGNRTCKSKLLEHSDERSVYVRLNIINLNKQGKMYTQGMAPVTRTLPGKPQWERIRDRPVHSVSTYYCKMYTQGMAPVTRTLPGKPQWERIRDRPVHSMDDNTFTLSFKYRTPENAKATSFFAFTYPFSRVDLLTITSHHGILPEKEERLKNMFPDNQQRPCKFQNKKTPSSFVFNGFLNLLLTKHDPIAIQLRKLYVFKMIPFLNPDGVARGHYRTDTRGVNLNRVYMNPSLAHHPTVYASRALISVKPRIH
ncbi:putative ATP/GTP binding protein-like 5 [Operophtera brumata]|uniref:Putative ATP/GTP binding protein-like 5 n=1 Tax=Operophtera brumata TaxID=104452 RepID=A0A0L7L142_OPEBR|nr:putative ATP/GTP binding protein-like 5 [Operophtera brumata]